MVEVIVQFEVDDRPVTVDEIEDEYLAEMLEHTGAQIKRQVERDKGRGTREGINTAQLKALEIPLAPVDEQRRIARILTTYHAQQAEMENQLTKFRQQKQGLMRDLLTGRVRAKVAD